MTRASSIVVLSSLALTTGCLVTPATRSTTWVTGTEDGVATFAQRGELVLSAAVDGSRVRVTAEERGECSRPVYEVHEITTTKRARLGGARDPRAMVFGALLAPITIPVSALITGVIIAADDSTTANATREIGTKRFACQRMARGTAVTMTLPTGAIAQGTTDAYGRIELEIPDTEPTEGTLRVIASGAAEQQLAYAVDPPPVQIARDAVTACSAQHHVEGRVTLKLAIGDRGLVKRLGLSAGDRELARCVAKQLTGVTFPPATRGSELSLPIDLPQLLPHLLPQLPPQLATSP